MALPVLTWLSTTLAKSASLQPLGMDTLRTLVGSAMRVTVVAAYWDKGFLTKLIDSIPPSRLTRTEIRLFLNGFTGQRGQLDTKTLRGLAREWRKRGLKNCEIRLVVSGRLFHTKVLLFEGVKEACVLVGSANATEAAFTDNEELMLMLRTAQIPQGLDQYLAAVAAAATLIDDVGPFQAHTLPAFFRMGSVYYKPVVVTQFRFDLRLPPGMRTALTTLQVPIPGMTARASQTYNPFVQVGLSLEEESELTEFAEADEAPSSGERVSLRSYGVQTCYGWWVPGAYDKELERKLKPARVRRSELLNRLSDLLENSSDVIRRSARQRFLDLEVFAKEKGFELREAPEARMTRFGEFLQRTGDRLADPTWRRRAEQPYIRALVPEVWSDPTSSSEFMNTFFDYLEFVAATRKQPLVWRSLRDKLDNLQDAPASRDIKAALQTYLKKPGWTGNEWELPRKSDGKSSQR